MALLMGKVCGMMSYVILLLVCGVIGSNISNIVMKNVFEISESEFNNSGFNFSIFKDFGGFGFVCLILSVVLAFILFGTIAGLFGSTCNKTEDIQDATGNVMMIAMVSYFAAIGVGAFDKDIVNVIAALLPPFSFFTRPKMIPFTQRSRRSSSVAFLGIMLKSSRCILVSKMVS